MGFFIQLVSLVAVAWYAIKRAGDEDWKLANLAIIVGSVVVGAVGALVIGYLLDNLDFDMVLTFSIVGGYIGSFGTLGGNSYRAGGIKKGRKARSDPSDKTVI